MTSARKCLSMNPAIFARWLFANGLEGRFRPYYFGWTASLDHVVEVAENGTDTGVPYGRGVTIDAAATDLMMRIAGHKLIENRDKGYAQSVIVPEVFTGLMELLPMDVPDYIMNGTARLTRKANDE